MEDMKSIVRYETEAYGYIKVKLADVMDCKGITRNALSKCTGVKYDVIDRYYQGESVERVDLDVLAKICYVLNCQIGDLLEFIPPESK